MENLSVGAEDSVAEPATNAVPALDLEPLDDCNEADEIILRELVADEKRYMGSLLTIWIRMGEVLIARREKCPHGTWRPWLKAHTRFSHDTARVYMVIAEKKDRVLSLPKDEPFRLLSDVYVLATEDDPEIRQALLEQSKNTGKSVRAVANERKAAARKKAAQKALQWPEPGQPTREIPGPNKAVKPEPESSSEPADAPADPTATPKRKFKADDLKNFDLNDIGTLFSKEVKLHLTPQEFLIFNKGLNSATPDPEVAVCAEKFFRSYRKRYSSIRQLG